MAFSGTFEGNSYTITGLYITGDVNYGGLFGCVGSGGTVKNLTVGGEVTVSGSGSSEAYIGGVAGFNSGTVENCRNEGTVTYVGGDSVSKHIGGVVGTVGYGGKVKNCYNTGEVWNDGGSFAGGVVGTVIGVNEENEPEAASVTNCYNTGAVFSDGVKTVSVSLVDSCYYLLSAAWRGVGNGAEYDEDGQFEGEVAAICAMEFATQDTFQPEAGVYWDFDVVWEIGTLDGSGAPIRPILQAIPEKLEEDLGNTEIGCFIDYSGDDCGCTRNCSCGIGKYRIFICDNITATIGGARVIAAEKDQIVTLTITPEDGYQLIAGSLRVTQESNVEEVTVTPESDGTYTFTMPQNIVHVWADFEKIPTVEPAEHEHRWAGGWSGNATHHWHECGNTDCTVAENSQKDGYAAHVWNDGEVTTAPTVDAEGVRTYTCTVCEATKTEMIPKLTESTPSGGGSGGSDGGSFSGDGSGGGSGSPGSTGAEVSAPSTSGGSTTVEVTAGSTTIGTTAKTELSGTNMDKAVSSAVTEAGKQGTVPVVEIEVKTSAQADSLEVTLPVASLETLAGTDDSSLVIISDVAEVGLDHAALDALVDQAEGKTIVLTVAPVEEKELTAAQRETMATVENTEVVDLTLMSGGTAIHDYKGGRLTITLPYELPEGSTAGDVKVYYISDSGALELLESSWKDGKVTFTTTHLSKYAISAGVKEGYAVCSKGSTCPIRPYTDAGVTAWYHDGVHYCVEKGLMVGYEDDTFRPDFATSRVMIATILWRLEGEPVVNYILPFDDVAQGAWYAEAIRWAATSGVIEGYGDGRFSPDDAITREQLTAMLYRYAGAGTVNGDLSAFVDAGSVSDWALEAMNWAVAQGIIGGKDGARLDPRGSALRAEAATMLQRFAELAE